MAAESAQDTSYIVYYQCSDCTLVFSDEASHENHICSAKSVSISILGEPVTLTRENYEALKPGRFILPKAPGIRNHLTLMKQTVLDIGEGNMPVVPGLEEKRSKYMLNQREEKKRARLERERLEKERKRAVKLKSFLKHVCSKCKEAFKELTLYKEHSCVKVNLEKKEEEKSSSYDKDHSYIDKELTYQCSRCQAFFESMPAYEGHPCFWEKGLPLVKPAEGSDAVNVKEVEIPSSSNVVPVSSEEVILSSENIPNSTIVPNLNKCDGSNGPSTSKYVPRLKRENIQTPTPWLCSVCNRYFRQRYYLIHHSCHPPSKNPLPRGALGKPPYICPKCGIFFKHKQSYCKHIHHECKKNERPEKVIPPHIPGTYATRPNKKKATTTEGPKVSKVLTSNQVKQFQCPVCNRYFARKYYLTHHACDPPSNNPLPRGSLGKPPFLCPACGVTYKHKQSYCRHIHHECGKGRKFFKTFSGKYAGKSKKKKDTSQKQVCILCNKEFQDQGALEVHVQVDHLSL